jgi:hypothetical protein
MAGTIVSDTIQDGAGASTSTTNVINGLAKAWAYTATGGATPTVSGSYNVSSITKTAAGTYQYNFTTALTNTNFAVASFGRINSNGCLTYELATGTSRTTSSITVIYANVSFSNTDPTTSSVIVHI